MDRIDPAPGSFEDWPQAIWRARGLMLALAIAPAMALAGGAASRGGQIAALFGAIVVGPAFVFISGCALRDALRAPSGRALLRGLAPIAICAALSCAAAAASGLALGASWRPGVAAAAPALRIVALPVAYALVMRLARMRTGVLLALALAGHAWGVLFDAPALVHFVYFVAGALAADRRIEIARRLQAERCFAAAALPLATAVSLILIGRAAASAGGLRDIGPLALLVGLAAGPAALASAVSMAEGVVGAVAARLGRVAPALAILWLPALFGLLAAAGRGAPASLASLALFALASLLFVALAADAVRDLTLARPALAPPAA